MTKDKLIERIKALDAHLAKLNADYNSALGAKQDCEFWLSEMENFENKVHEDSTNESSL